MRIEKQQLVQDLQAFLGPDRNVILINYKGLDVDAFAELRRALEKLHAESHVVPNRLFLRAAAEAGCSELAQAQLKGETALVTAGEDPVQVAKELNAFMKEHPECSFKYGYIDRRVYSPEELLILTRIPPKEVLQAQLVGVLQGPMRQLVGVLNAKVGSIVYALKAYLDKKQEQQGSN